MTTYRTGNHWGVTIICSPSGSEQRADGDELVAVVVNGDRDLAEHICERLNERETAQVSASPATKTVQQPSAGGNGRPEAQRGAEGFEINGVGHDFHEVELWCRCGWNVELPANTSLAELNRRAAEHAEVCR